MSENNQTAVQPAAENATPDPTNTNTSRAAAQGHASTKEKVDADCLFIIKIILAFVFPPLAVALDRGCGTELILNIILTICGYIPGVVHALFVILRCGSSDDDLEAGTAAPAASQPVPANNEGRAVEAAAEKA